MAEQLDGEEIAARALQRQWPWTITLKYPVDFGNERITELTVRRGRLGDLKGVKLNGEGIAADDLLVVAARMCGRSLKVIELLDPEDAEEVVALALDFFSKCLGGGRTR